MTRTEDLLCCKSNVQKLRQGKKCKDKEISVIVIEFVTETLYFGDPRLRLCVGVFLASSGSLPGFTEEGQVLMALLGEFVTES